MVYNSNPANLLSHLDLLDSSSTDYFIANRITFTQDAGAFHLTGNPILLSHTPTNTIDLAYIANQSNNHITIDNDLWVNVPSAVVLPGDGGITLNGLVRGGVENFTKYLRLGGTEGQLGIFKGQTQAFGDHPTHLFGGIIKSGTSTWEVASAPGSTVADETFIRGGTLRLGATNALPQGSSLYIFADSSTFATFDMAGYDQRIFGLASNEGVNRVINSHASERSTLTIDVANPWLSREWRSDIQGDISVVKTGPGTQIFTAPNTYTGGTLIKQGTLQIRRGHIRSFRAMPKSPRPPRKLLQGQNATLFGLTPFCLQQINHPGALTKAGTKFIFRVLTFLIGSGCWRFHVCLP
jgi:autotransporter-associated beta strand protein